MIELSDSETILLMDAWVVLPSLAGHVVVAL